MSKIYQYACDCKGSMFELISYNQVDLYTKCSTCGAEDEIRSDSPRDGVEVTDLKIRGEYVLED